MPSSAARERLEHGDPILMSFFAANHRSRCSILVARLASLLRRARRQPPAEPGEPTASLDARSEHRLFEQMRELARGRTLLLISHRFSTVRSADRIYVIHEGQVVEEGSHDQLMAHDGRYAEMFNLQAQSYR